MFSSHCNMSHHRCQNTLTPPARAMHLCVSIPAMCTASNPAHFFTTTVKDAAHASESVFLYLPPCCARHRIFPHTHARKAAGAAAAAPKVVTCPADAAVDFCAVPVWLLPSLPSLRLLLLLPPPPSPRPLLTASAEEGGGSSSGSSRSSGRESRNRTKIDRLPCRRCLRCCRAFAAVEPCAAALAAARCTHLCTHLLRCCCYCGFCCRCCRRPAAAVTHD